MPYGSPPPNTLPLTEYEITEYQNGCYITTEPNSRFDTICWQAVMAIELQTENNYLKRRLKEITQSLK